MKQPIIRCPWPTDALYRAYHDQEWGVPVHDDRRLFEYLIYWFHDLLRQHAGHRHGQRPFDNVFPAQGTFLI